MCRLPLIAAACLEAALLLSACAGPSPAPPAAPAAAAQTPQGVQDAAQDAPAVPGGPVLIRVPPY